MKDSELDFAEALTNQLTDLIKKEVEGAIEKYKQQQEEESDSVAEMTEDEFNGLELDCLKALSHKGFRPRQLMERLKLMGWELSLDEVKYMLKKSACFKQTDKARDWWKVIQQ